MITSNIQFDQALRSLLGDLRQLFPLVFTHRRPVPEASIRLASVILRKWLADGLLTKLAHLANVDATLPALDNQDVISEIQNKGDIVYFLTGGVMMNCSPVSGVYYSKLDAPEAPRIPIHTMDSVKMPVKAFLNQRRVYFDGSYFTTEEILRYTANKLGGAHLDFNRTGKFAVMERASEFMTYGGPPAPPAEPPGEMYLVFEPASNEILSGFHIEVIAAAASFIQIEFDGERLLPLTVKRSLRSRFKSLLGRKSKVKLYARGQKADRDLNDQ